MFLLMKACFSWLPLPLYLLVSAVFSIFIIIVVIDLLRLIIEVIKFLKDLLGGLIAKVVGFFV